MFDILKRGESVKRTVCWIPACEGMTIENIYQGRSKTYPYAEIDNPPR